MKLSGEYPAFDGVEYAAVMLQADVEAYRQFSLLRTQVETHHVDFQPADIMACRPPFLTTIYRPVRPGLYDPDDPVQGIAMAVCETAPKERLFDATCDGLEYFMQPNHRLAIPHLVLLDNIDPCAARQIEQLDRPAMSVTYGTDGAQNIEVCNPAYVHGGERAVLAFEQVRYLHRLGQLINQFTT